MALMQPTRWCQCRVERFKLVHILGEYVLGFCLFHPNALLYERPTLWSDYDSKYSLTTVVNTKQTIIGIKII
jgi:hypothetical protein